MMNSNFFVVFGRILKCSCFEYFFFSFVTVNFCPKTSVNLLKVSFADQLLRIYLILQHLLEYDREIFHDLLFVYSLCIVKQFCSMTLLISISVLFHQFL